MGDIIYFDVPCNKDITTIRKGDIFRTEYGAEGNWVAVILDDLELTDKWCKIIGRFADSNKYVEMYAPTVKDNCEFKVVGKELQ